MSTEMLLAKEKLIKAIRTCLKNNQPPEEKSIAVLLAEESILTVMQTLEEKQIDTESMQELLLQFSKDLPTLDESIDDMKLLQQMQSHLILPIRTSIQISSTEINPLYNEVLKDLDSIPPGNENDHFNAESDLIKSLLNKDTVITFPKIDFLLEEFAGELALINPIPSGIDEVDFDHEEDIRLTEKLLYDNSSPRPLEELNSEISIESFSPSPIPIEDSDSLMEEIDTFLASDDSIPPGIDSDGYDSEEDNLFLEYDLMRAS
ncbi:hypothetical protein Tco_0227422 [Tanacetum coccineum]